MFYIILFIYIYFPYFVYYYILYIVHLICLQTLYVLYLLYILYIFRFCIFCIFRTTTTTKTTATKTTASRVPQGRLEERSYSNQPRRAQGRKKRWAQLLCARASAPPRRNPGAHYRILTKKEDQNIKH